MENRSCQANQRAIFFSDGITNLADNGNNIDITYLDFCKSVDTALHDILLKTKSKWHTLNGFKSV